MLPDCKELQSDLSMQGEWATKCQKKSSVTKGKGRHMGSGVENAELCIHINHGVQSGGEMTWGCDG